MYYPQTDNLGIHEIADNWSKQLRALPSNQILQILIDAFWSGEFEPHKNEKSKLADPNSIFPIMRNLGGVPWALTHIKDEEEPTVQHLIGIPFEKYGAGGQNILANLEFDKGMFGSWCDFKRFARPEFWFNPAHDNKSTDTSPGLVIVRQPPFSRFGARADPQFAEAWEQMCKIYEEQGASAFSNQSDLARELIHSLNTSNKLELDQVRKWVSKFKRQNNIK